MKWSDFWNWLPLILVLLFIVLVALAKILP
jgi:hypothetical protein